MRRRPLQQFPDVGPGPSGPAGWLTTVRGKIRRRKRVKPRRSRQGS